MKIGFVVQRYGAEILGGSEYHCRLIAERLAVRHSVDVLTTCARDYITWKNEYPEGTDRIRGVTVRRFANAHERDIQAFNRYSDWIFANPHTRDDEMKWLEMQGPWCPKLLDYLQAPTTASYDALIFFTYLYAPTVLGLEIDPVRSILVPTAHDEPAIRLDLYKDVFRRPTAIAYNTEVERNFLKSTFAIRAIGEETVGCGVDLMAGEGDGPPVAPIAGERSARTKRTAASTSSLSSSHAASRSGVGTGCTASSCSTAAASTPARAAKNCSSTSPATRNRVETRPSC